MITKDLINELANGAGLEIVDTIMHPFGRCWQAVVFFTPEYGVSILYNMPEVSRIHQKPDFDFGLVERGTSGNDSFCLIDNDECTYDLDKEEAIDFLRRIEWSDPPTVTW